jgi:AAA+ superfamily predicted ATPase
MLLFLTANRVEIIDDAISSRIHVMIKYEKLSISHGQELLEGFLNKIDSMSLLSNKEIQELARKKLNGREVRCPLTLMSLLLMAPRSRMQ